MIYLGCVIAKQNGTKSSKKLSPRNFEELCVSSEKIGLICSEVGTKLFKEFSAEYFGEIDRQTRQ
jgi:hypothetical protein